MGPMTLSRRQWLAAAGLAGTGVWAEPPVVRIVYADYRPYSWQDGPRVRGLEIDIAEALFVGRLGLKVQHEIKPWARAQADVERGEADLFFATRNPVRDAYARPLGPPLLHWQAAAFLRTDTVIKPPPGLLRLPTLCEWRLGALLGNQWVATYLPCAVATRAANTEALLKMLLADRFDAAVEDRLVLLDRAAQLGVSTRVRVLPLEVAGEAIYLQMGRRSPLQSYAELIEQTLHHMQSDGSLAKLSP